MIVGVVYAPAVTPVLTRLVLEIDWDGRVIVPVMVVLERVVFPRTARLDESTTLQAVVLDVELVTVHPVCGMGVLLEILVMRP